MRGTKAQYLLATLLTILAARGQAPEALDPWHAWLSFKQFVRTVDELPDPGISVQLFGQSDEAGPRLVFLRQVLEAADEGSRLEPVGGVVCEMCFAPRPVPLRSAEMWSFDRPTLESFIDTVEQSFGVADLLVDRPIATSVFWEPAIGDIS